MGVPKAVLRLAYSNQKLIWFLFVIRRFAYSAPSYLLDTKLFKSSDENVICLFGKAINEHEIECRLWVKNYLLFALDNILAYQIRSDITNLYAKLDEHNRQSIWLFSKLLFAKKQKFYWERGQKIHP